MKGTAHEDGILTVNVYVSNNRVPNTWSKDWQKLKGELDKSTIIPGDFNISLSVIDRNSWQKIKDIEMKNTINQLVLTDIYRTLYPIAAEYIYF